MKMNQSISRVFVIVIPRALFEVNEIIEINLNVKTNKIKKNEAIRNKRLLQNSQIGFERQLYVILF